MTNGLEIAAAIETLGSQTEAAAAGSGAALAGALAAAVVAKAARVSSLPAVAAQAVTLQRRLLRYARADAAALGAARSALAQATAETDDPQQSFQLGRALRHAMDVPFRIGEACSDVAALAADEREAVVADYRPDLAAAAALAAGAAHAAAHLVAVNLVLMPDDPEVVGARRFAARASDVARLFGEI